MSIKKKQFFSAKNVTYLAVLLALVIVLQLTLGQIKVGTTSFSVVLIPIIMGAVLIGPLAGGILGFAFGLIVLLYGVTGVDAFTNILFVNHPFLTSFTCLLKGTAAGVVPGILYNLLKGKNSLAAMFLAAASAPIVNTGIFILLALTMSGTLQENFVADGQTVIYFLVIGCAGVNFIVEFLVNMIAAPLLANVVKIVERQIKK